MAEYDVPAVELDLADRAFNRDPYPTLRNLYDLGPVVYNATARRYMVTRYRDCSTVLGDLERFDSSGSVARLRVLFGGDTMETIDQPARHARIRRIWSPWFAPAGVQALRRTVARIVEREVGTFAERCRAGEVVDAVAEMNRHIPTLVIADMLGVDDAVYGDFATWSDAMGAQLQATFDDSPEARRLVELGGRATAQLNNYVSSLVAERRRHPGEDLVSAMVHADAATELLGDDDVVASITQLVFAGNETTAGMMGTVLFSLALHPDQQRAVAGDDALIGPAFEEVHRWQTLSQGGSARFACSERSMIGPIHIPRGAEVMALVGLANRDPQRWDDPDRFDVTRRPIRAHLGFGTGIHSCLGIHLARLEVAEWLRRVLRELPDFQLAGEVEWGTNYLSRTPVRVPIAA